LSLLLSKLGCSEAELKVLEHHDVLLPLRWIAPLRKLELMGPDESKQAWLLPGLVPQDGIWMERQRKALRLSPEALAGYLQASEADVRVIETNCWPVPTAWLPILSKLRDNPPPVKVEPTVVPIPTERKTAPKLLTPNISAKNTAMPSSALSPTKSPSIAASSPASVTPKATAVSGFAETIVEYRLKLGRHAGLPALEVIELIAHDLLVAKCGDAQSYDALSAAMKVLLLSKPGR